MIPVDGDFILEVAPTFSGRLADRQKAIVGAISGEFDAILRSYDINTPLRIAHFMGQVTHECAGFRTTEEFASGAAYEGRSDLGNTEKGDGKRFKGRGLIQLTGRFNYRKFGDVMDLPLEDEPLRAGDPLVSLRIACEYWKDRKINGKCDADDMIAVTRAVNGGTNGLDDRIKYYRRAKTALAKRGGMLVASAQPDSKDPVLRRGSFGDAVVELQKLLNAAGSSLTVDSDFGGVTELAVMTFQRSKGLKADGIVGAQTWAALSA